MPLIAQRPIVRVIVVDAHPVFRKGLIDVLNEAPDMVACGEAGSVQSAMGAVRASRPDVAVVDLMLGEEDGLDLVAAIAAECPDVRVLVSSGRDERLYAEGALRAGALGYIMKDRPPVEWLAAIRQVASSRLWVSAEMAERQLMAGTVLHGHPSRFGIERLTDRERHVLALVGHGLGTREIAAHLNLSIKTVETHYAHMKDKLGLRNGRELIRMAVTWCEERPH